MLIDRIRKLIHHYDDRNAYLRPFLREPKGHETFLSAMLVLRYAALLLVMVGFIFNISGYADSPQLFNLVRISLVSSLIYILALGAVRVLAQPIFIDRKSKLV